MAWVWSVGGVACGADVGAGVRDAGGPYLYARATFGRFAGIQTGWMAYLARLTASASVANLFVIYLGEFWPGTSGRAVGIAVLAILLGSLALVNYRGVGLGFGVSRVIA